MNELPSADGDLPSAAGRPFQIPSKILLMETGGCKKNGNWELAELFASKRNGVGSFG